MKDILKRLKIHSLKNNRKKILKNFYSKEMRGGKTFRANYIDKFFFIIFFFVLLLIFLVIKSQEFLLSLYISSISMFFISSLYFKINKRVEDKKIKEINEELKEKKILKQYENHSREDFINSMKGLLEEYLNVDLNEGNSPMDLKFTRDGEVCGIKCLQSTLEYKIPSREIGVFIRELKERDIEKAIIVTNSYFIDKERYKDKIVLYDFDDIVQMLKDTNEYPSDMDMENYIVDRFLDRRSSIQKEIKMMSTKKIIQLYVISLIFYFMSYFVQYSLYYKIVSIISFVLATSIGAYNISEYVYIKAK